jgi:hypothetical protein
MNQYRPATAADIGRDDVEFYSRHFVGNIFPAKGKLVHVRDLRMPGEGIPHYVYRDESLTYWPYARVPILPEELDKLRNTLREIEAHTENRASSVPLDKLPELLEETKIVQYPDFPGVPLDPPLTLDVSYFTKTIRRKLEAGGYAEPEQAVYLDGRYYSTEWIKSGVGVLPQQVEIVK